MADVLGRIIARNRAGDPVAIASVCSAHPDGLCAARRLAQRLDRAVVIAATSDQVNQNGGYTGLTPAAFISFVNGLADDTRTDRARIIFGGDHLGPQVWRKLPAAQAMDKARVMVADYAAAGFPKIHLDCSKGCAGEAAHLTDAMTVPRAADLAPIATTQAANLLCVVGTGVPLPGGTQLKEPDDIPATTPAAARATPDAHMEAFRAIGDIGGLVVQPGVAFSPMTVPHLPIGRNPGLRPAIADHPGVCLEAQSTDYQHDAAFPRLAALGFRFQKLGPALTFAYRQAVYALDHLRNLAGWGEETLRPQMERIMLASPGHWQGFYHGTPPAQRLQRHFGLADRIRHYWAQPDAQRNVIRLLADLARHPLPLLSQCFAPDVIARAAVIGGPLPQALIAAQIELALDPYFFGTGGSRP